jgi:simple sugar transport system ATP-binding protein
VTVMGQPGPEPNAEPDDVLKAVNLTKAFGSVVALRDASISLPRGRVTALIGDNGAGKSTLVRCLSGVYQADAGTIDLDGRGVKFRSPTEARDSGIETVHQNLALVDDLTVWQNLFLGRERTRGIGPVQLLDRRGMREEAKTMVSALAINVPNVTSRVRRLSGGQRQAVSIARSAGWGSKIVIMDEPTAALGVQETGRVEELIRGLREKGMTILLVSHNFDQVMRLADGVWVMRAGRIVGYRTTADTTGEELVGLVTGAIKPDLDHHSSTISERPRQHESPRLPCSRLGRRLE